MLAERFTSILNHQSNDNPSLGFGFHVEQRSIMGTDLGLEQQFELAAFIEQTPHIEVWKNLHDEHGEHLTRYYERIREDIKTSGDHSVIIGATGLNGSGKGSLLMGYHDLLASDPDLDLWADANGVEIDIAVFPSSLYRDVKRKLATNQKIPFSTNNKDITDDEFADIAQQKWQDITDYIESAKKWNKKRNAGEKARKVIVLIESGAPNGLPIADTFPVKIEGQDRNLSPLLNAAMDPDLRQHFHGFIMLSNPAVTEATILHRENTAYMHAHEVLFGRDINYFFTDKNGQRRDMLQVANELKMQGRIEDLKSFAAFIDMTRATPEAIDTSRERFTTFLSSLEKQGKISFDANALDSDKETRYLDLFKERLGVVGEKFTILSGEYLRGSKSLNYDYFLYGPVVRKYHFLLDVLTERFKEEFLAAYA